jgi:hypothetical protein
MSTVYERIPVHEHLNEERHLDKYIDELRNEIAETNGRFGDIH